MNLLILPISGGSFPVQIASIISLTEINYVPNLTLGTSGGNVSAYVASISNWKKNKIYRISNQIKSSLFCSHWSSLNFLSNLIGFFRGNLYNKGNGMDEFINNNFNSKTIQNDEIWTGCYNSTKKKAKIFCNLEKRNSILKDEDFNLDLTQTLPPEYLNGNIEKISKVNLASASIPGFVPPQNIDGDIYMDGGVATSSPLTALKNPISNYIIRNRKNLHITYCSPMEIDYSKDSPIFNMIDNLKQATDDIIRYQTVSDRLIAYDLVKLLSKSNDIEQIVLPCNRENLIRIFELRKNIKCSLLEIYPKKIIKLNLDNFDGSMVTKAINESLECLYCNLWIPKLESETYSKSVYDYLDINNSKYKINYI